MFQVMDGAVILAAIILNPLARKRRKREAEDNSVLSPVMTQIDSLEVSSDITRIEPTPPGKVEFQMFGCVTRSSNPMSSTQN